ncbi:MAG: universal stress protein [Chloroflexales bacterium]|nr:universal stress protein [Chloroflexales bacterium]
MPPYDIEHWTHDQAEIEIRRWLLEHNLWEPNLERQRMDVHNGTTVETPLEAERASSPDPTLLTQDQERPEKAPAPPRTILVPLDESPFAEQVLPYVQILAPLIGARIHLLRVVTDAEQQHLMAYKPVTLHGLGDWVSDRRSREHQAWETLQNFAEGYLDSTAPHLRKNDVLVNCSVATGPAAEAIVKAAEQHDATLIAMATHGYSGLRRWALGSVTDRVVHMANVPVFVIRGRQEPTATLAPPRRILVPLDGSQFARQALPLAVRLAAAAHAELLLLMVVEPTMHLFPEPAAMGPTAMAGWEAVEARREQARTTIEEIAAPLREQYQLPITVRAVVGHIAEEIIEQASRHEMDLIIMTTHGYSGLQRWALGSIADKVLHAATVPLVLVRVHTIDN